MAQIYRAEGNWVLDHGHYQEALTDYRRGLAIVHPLENWAESELLIEGMNEALKTVSPRLTAMDFLRRRLEVFSPRWQ